MTMQASGTDGFTFPDNTIQKTAFAPGMRNKIINGAMMIDQRNSGAAVTISAAGTSVGYVLDRFQFQNNVTSGTMTVQQSSTAPTGFSKSVVITNGAAVTASAAQSARFWQAIEGFNFADLNYGSASAQTTTLSFWVRNSITGTYAGSVVNDNANRSYVFTYTVNSANTWEQKSVTIPGDTSGTWVGATNALAAYIFFDLGSGSDRNGTAGSWTATYSNRTSGSTNWVGTNGATFYITGVQLEKGATATPFENRLYGTELALAQRYYEALQPGSIQLTVPNASLLSYQEGSWHFKVTKRAAPTVGFIAGTSLGSTLNSPNIGTITPLGAAAAGSGLDNCLIYTNTSSSYTTGQVFFYTGGGFYATAEL